jgi:hypothetical protein
VTIFDLPAGRVYDITTERFLCHHCGRRAHDIKYKAMATSSLKTGADGVLRRLFVFHNPICACDEGIWLTDGPVTATRSSGDTNNS